MIDDDCPGATMSTSDFNPYGNAAAGSGFEVYPQACARPPTTCSPHGTK